MGQPSHQGKQIVWENGVPRPAYVEPVNKTAAHALTTAALSLPYRPLRAAGPCEPDCVAPGEMPPLECPKHGAYNDGEKQYEGYSRAEVMYLRQADAAAWGDLDAMKNLEDRWLGKPKQETLNVSIGGSFQDFLNALPRPADSVAAITVKDVTLIEGL